jgi:hypothetical protein
MNKPEIKLNSPEKCLYTHIPPICNKFQWEILKIKIYGGHSIFLFHTLQAKNI